MDNNQLRSITFCNYKGFKKGNIEIKPITILLGANSVGKSSIIQLFQLLYQTAMVEEHRSVLKLNGSILSLGEHENIFYNKNTNENIKITFEIKNRKLYDGFKKNFNLQIIRKLLQSTDIFEKYLFIKEKNFSIEPLESLQNIRMKYSKYYNDISNISKSDFIKISTKLSKYHVDIENNKNKIDKYYYNPEKQDYISKKITKNDIIKQYDKVYKTFNDAESIRTSIFNVEITISLVKSDDKKYLKIKRIRLLNSSKCIFDLEFTLSHKSNIGLSLTSVFNNNKPLFDYNQEQDFISSLNNKGTIFTLFNINDKYSLVESPIVKTIHNIFQETFDNLRRSFSRNALNHIGPIRANPKRYYFLDRSSLSLDMDKIDEDTLTEILKEKSLIRKSVNKWLDKFEISISVTSLVDIIHKLKIKQNDLFLDITDVGFGISQVLPILVQCFLSDRGSTTMIEQPEIHLHPTMQADLADLFIDVVSTSTTDKKNTTKFLIIETHSEYLLKRLRRRIAENNSIHCHNVGINFVSVSGKFCEIEKKNVSKTGYFEWPKSFYSGELLKDSVEFIKLNI